MIIYSMEDRAEIAKSMWENEIYRQIDGIMLRLNYLLRYK